jgi:hypothetical protein
MTFSHVGQHHQGSVFIFPLQCHFAVIPAKAGIQVEKTGFPHIKYGGGLSGSGRGL